MLGTQEARGPEKGKIRARKCGAISRKLLAHKEVSNMEQRIARKLLSKKRNLSWYLLGFADAEGCFSVALKRQKGTRFGVVLDPLFQVTQHKNNRIILEKFLDVLSCGRIIEKPGQKDLLVYLVDNRRQLKEKVINFFERYPPIAKMHDFRIFREIVLAMENKEHHTISGFKRLVKLAFEMNLAGKQRRRKLEDIMNELEQAAPQRLYVEHPQTGDDKVRLSQ